MIIGFQVNTFCFAFSISGTRQCICTFKLHTTKFQTAVDKDPVYRFTCSFQCLLGHIDFSNMIDQLMMYWHVSAKPFYLKNLFNYSMRIRESVRYCLVKKSQILISITLPAPPLFHEILGVKKCRLYAPFYRKLIHEILYSSHMCAV